MEKYSFGNSDKIYINKLTKDSFHSISTSLQSTKLQYILKSERVEANILN